MLLTVLGRNHINKDMKTIDAFLFCVLLLTVPVFVCAENIWEDENPPNTSASGQTEVSSMTSNTGGYSNTDPDATYTIKKGDTLWDLAFSFLGNPFEWQRIWEINPYIKNPDLIYPGDRLAIPGRTGSSSGEPVPAGLIPSETLGALDLNKNSSGTAAADYGYPGDLAFLESLKRKNVLSEEQLSSAPFLWTERNARGQIYPGNGRIDAPKSGASYQLFGKVHITVHDGEYRAGDTLAVYKSLRFVEFKGKTANLVKLAGKIVVLDVFPKKMTALLVSMNDVVTGGERVARIQHHASIVIDSLVPPSSVISAAIFTRVEETESPYPFQMCILDKGSTHGVDPGDVFAVYSSGNKQLSVVGIIVHVTGESSTLCMVYMRQNRIETGDTAQLVRRALISGQTSSADNSGGTITPEELPEP